MRRYFLLGLLPALFACGYATAAGDPSQPTPDFLQEPFAAVQEPPLNHREQHGTLVYRVTRLDAWRTIQWIAWLRIDADGGTLHVRQPLGVSGRREDFNLGAAPKRARLDRADALVLAGYLDEDLLALAPDTLNRAGFLDADLLIIESVTDTGYAYSIGELGAETPRLVYLIRGRLP
ncbi:MAG: hypothetical protein SF070_13305 [Gemmatimonadota bacterium]|nr:hypothetical protein [Gemmatimonadota bacterium]